MTVCTVHTHSLFCDGTNSLPEMAQAAWEGGAEVFGASGHSYTPISWDQGNVLPEEPLDYRAEVLRLREAYAGRMEVLLGIEQDSCSPQPVPDWADYWIGSVHNLYEPQSGRYDAIDWDAEKLAACCSERFLGDALAMTESYYAAVSEMARRNPTILGHLDLIVKLNRNSRFFDESAPRYRLAALSALHAADPAKTLLEINTGAMARGYRTTPYPALFLLREWRRMHGQVIFTSDAHSVEGIFFAYDQAAELARTAGFSAHTILTRNGPVEIPLNI